MLQIKDSSPVQVDRPLTAVNVAASEDFVNTPYITELTNRAMGYLNAGFPIHLLGPTGSGKTTLAFHIGELIGRPVVLIYGDDELGTSDLIGADSGMQRRKVVDNYVHTVLKVEEEITQNWVDNRLTFACREGYTLIYDEFTRSRAEANNALLSVLSERVLVLPARQGRRGYIKVHPNFRAIFSSNPAEYIGTHRTQDALLDRMITINVSGLDRETEIEVTASHSGLDITTARQIVELIDAMRGTDISDSALSVRACIMIGKVAQVAGLEPNFFDPRFKQIFFDVLHIQTPAQQSKFDEVCQRILS